MIDIPTVLILGAGASIPYGYPSGAKLIDNILMRLSQQRSLNPPNYRQELFELGFTELLIESFISDLLASKAYSIDEFLEHRSDYREIGKIAIAQVIIGCETSISKDDLLARLRRTSKRDEEGWYSLLLSALSSTIEQLRQNKLAIITFNYDRSLEHFLYDALIAKYGEGAKPLIIDAIKSLDIIHVHGKLGDLPWETSLNSRPYGQKKNLHELKASGDLITILYEGDRQSHEFERAQATLVRSDRIVFLGFGYHISNLQRLRVEWLSQSSKKILGTRLGLADLEVYNLSNRFPALRLLQQVPAIDINAFLKQVINLNGGTLLIG